MYISTYVCMWHIYMFMYVHLSLHDEHKYSMDNISPHITTILILKIIMLHEVRATTIHQLSANIEFCISESAPTSCTTQISLELLCYHAALYVQANYCYFSVTWDLWSCVLKHIIWDKSATSEISIIQKDKETIPHSDKPHTTTCVVHISLQYQLKQNYATVILNYSNAEFTGFFL